MSVNVLGPALLSTYFIPLVKRGSAAKKVWLNVTSGLGSIGMNFGPKNATYSIAKAALNMFVSDLRDPLTARILRV
jgi:NAD(P)-dependent dehydrogenase (short-subunit alcohol dehydrogenase family)